MRYIKRKDVFDKRYNDIFFNIYVCSIITLFFLINGCSGHHILYSDSVLEPQSVAILQGGIPITLHEIDGKKGPRWYPPKLLRSIYNSRWDWSFCIELAPGPHTLLVTYDEYRLYGLEKQWANRVSIDFEAKPGGRYKIKSLIDGIKWTPKVVELVE